MLGQQAVALPHAADPPDETWMPRQRQFLGDPQRAVAGVSQAWSRIACSIVSPTRLGCGPLAPGSRSSRPSAPKVWKLRRIS